MLVSVVLAALLLSSLVSCNEPIQVICNSDVYGQPASADANLLAQNLPFAKIDPKIQPEAIGLRIFSEPSFLPGRFQELKNRFERSMVQIPRLWKQSECKIVLLKHHVEARR